MGRALLAAALVALAAAPAGAQDQTRTLNLSAYAELLRSDVRAQKVAIITEVMGFREQDDKSFWPIYREYDAAMTKLGDERVALVAAYAKNYDQMTDAVAADLAVKALDLEARRQALKAKYFDNVRAALGARTALRALRSEEHTSELQSHVN